MDYKNTYRYCALRLHREKDRAIIEWLEKQRSMTEAIRQAIIKAMKEE